MDILLHLINFVGLFILLLNNESTYVIVNDTKKGVAFVMSEMSL